MAGVLGSSAVECSKSYGGDSGTITSYNFPFDYRHNLTCVYHLHVGSASHQPPRSSHVICLKFRRFSLETSSPFCSFDYLEVGWNPAVKYCGRGLWQYGVADATNRLSTVWSSNFCCKWPVLSGHFLQYKVVGNLPSGPLLAPPALW